VARDLFRDGGLAATIVGPEGSSDLDPGRLRI
jgi:hypothetical protein